MKVVTVEAFIAARAEVFYSTGNSNHQQSYTRSTAAVLQSWIDEMAKAIARG